MLDSRVANRTRTTETSMKRLHIVPVADVEHTTTMRHMRVSSVDPGAVASDEVAASNTVSLAKDRVDVPVTMDRANGGSLTIKGIAFVSTASMKLVLAVGTTSTDGVGPHTMSKCPLVVAHARLSSSHDVLACTHVTLANVRLAAHVMPPEVGHCASVPI